MIAIDSLFAPFGIGSAARLSRIRRDRLSQFLAVVLARQHPKAQNIISDYVPSRALRRST